MAGREPPSHVKPHHRVTSLRGTTQSRANMEKVEVWCYLQIIHEAKGLYLSDVNNGRISDIILISPNKLVFLPYLCAKLRNIALTNYVTILACFYAARLIVGIKTTYPQSD